MTATPDVRLDDPARSTDSRYPAVDSGVSTEPAVPSRVVTPEQVDRAVVQLRERRGRTAAEQMQAVLRALELTVECRRD